jgi:hypothetical protein
MRLRTVTAHLPLTTFVAAPPEHKVRSFSCRFRVASGCLVDRMFRGSLQASRKTRLLLLVRHGVTRLQKSVIVCLPRELSDEAAAQLIEFLYELTEALERHYAGQLLALFTPEAPTTLTASLDFITANPHLTTNRAVLRHR